MVREWWDELYKGMPKDSDDPQIILQILGYCIDSLASDSEHDVKDVLVSGTDRLTYGELLEALVISKTVIEGLSMADTG